MDYITPPVDDPYWFGQIAAANSISDVYAMGGRPVVALNIVCFPEDDFPLEMLETILRGGADIVRQAGAVIAGFSTSLFGVGLAYAIDATTFAISATAFWLIRTRPRRTADG